MRKYLLGVTLLVGVFVILTLVLNESNTEFSETLLSYKKHKQHKTSHHKKKINKIDLEETSGSSLMSQRKKRFRKSKYFFFTNSDCIRQCIENKSDTIICGFAVKNCCHRAYCVTKTFFMIPYKQVCLQRYPIRGCTFRNAM